MTEETKASNATGKPSSNDSEHHDVEQLDDKPQSNSDKLELPKWRLSLVMISIFIGLFLSFLDTTIVAVALATIADHFGEFDNSTWVFTAYMLTYMACGVLLTRFSDIFGMKVVEIACMTLFLAMSLGCALSNNMTALIVFRALQGIGGSGMFSMTAVIALKTVPAKQVPKVASYIGATQAVAAIVGPILSGAITHKRTSSTWRWIFYLNLPLGGIALALLLLAWPRHLEAKAKWSALKTIDYLGAILLLAASVLLILALQQAGSYTWSWGSGATIASLVISFLSFAGFIVWETFLAKSSSMKKILYVFPVQLMVRRVDGAAMLATILNGFVFYIVVVNLPDRFQIVDGNGPVIAGVRLLPALAGGAIGTFLAGGLSNKHNWTAYTLVVAFALQTIGYGLLTTLGHGHHTPKGVYGYQILIGLGFGMSIASTSLMVAFRYYGQKEHTAVMQGSQTQGRTFGGSLGIAIANIVLNKHIRDSVRLARALNPAQLHGLAKSPLIISTFTTAQRLQVGRVFADAFTQQMRVATCIAAAGFVVSLATLERRMPLTASEQEQQSSRSSNGQDCDDLTDREGSSQ